MAMVRLSMALLAGLVAALLALGSAACGGEDTRSGETRADLNPHPVAGNFEPSELRLEECVATDTAFSACLEQGFGNLAFEQGPKPALRRFAAEIAADQNVERGCHRIAHTIGSAALARYDGDVGRAFSEGDSTCWSGYYHGILERGLQGADSDVVLTATIRRLCTGVRDDEARFVYYQCVHGLGHGLMIQTGLDLRRSLDQCTRLEGAWEQTSCDGGVFMENFNTSYGVKSRFLRDDDPVYPCNAIAERHKLYCYLQVTDRVLSLNGWDWRAAGSSCARVEAAWRDTCFQSLGRSASGFSRNDRALVLELCTKAPAAYRGECVYGVVRDMASNDAGGRRAARYCAVVGAEQRARCFYGLGTILSDLGRQAECDEVPARYRVNCRLRDDGRPRT